MQAGDTMVVTKLDRIARSATQGIELVQKLLDKGIVVHVINMGLMDNTPTGKLIRNIMLAFAEFERDMIVERTQEGKAIAKQNPDFKDGRPKKFSKVQINHAVELLNRYSYRQVQQMTGISKSTLIRAKKDRRI
jgi:DNA invertase Pin-like site-specific DNA recombinase